MKRTERANPLLSFVLDGVEYEQLNSIAAIHGVSVAQIARGYFRMGRELVRAKAVRWGDSPKTVEQQLDIVRLGAFPRGN